MNKIWLIVVVILLISGSVLIHFEYLALGGSLMLAGLLLAWAWLPLQYVQIWFKNRKKV